MNSPGSLAKQASMTYSVQCNVPKISKILELNPDQFTKFWVATLYCFELRCIFSFNSSFKKLGETKCSYSSNPACYDDSRVGTSKPYFPYFLARNSAGDTQFFWQEDNISPEGAQPQQCCAEGRPEGKSVWD